LSSATLDFKQPLHQLSEGFHDFLQGWCTGPALQRLEEGAPRQLECRSEFCNGFLPMHFPRTIRPGI
jgi:hypothetical protein